MKAERHRGGSRERKTTAMTEWRSRWCLTCMPTQTLTCRTNFWSMYFLAMLGWNSWLSKNRMKNSYTNWREEEKKKRRDGGMEGGWEREREKMLKRFRISARSSIKLVWSAECWTGSHKRPAGQQQADSKIQEKSADWHVTVRNKIP